jgi:capsule biosynthesis phosphatase
MITVVLAAGLGERFSMQGYPSPKPATMVDGKPMIVRVLQEAAVRAPARIILNRIHRGWRIDELIYSSGIDGIDAIELDHTTRGPAETLLLGLENIEERQSVLVLDCDVLHPSIVSETSSAMSCGAIFCFEDFGQSPIFSYVSCRPDGDVDRIAEKEKISSKACSGAYFFPHAGRLREACRHVIRMGEKSRGEYYISNVISRLLAEGERFIAPVYSPYRCLGTPEQLREVCASEQRTCEGLRLCFDLDGTLVSHPAVRGDYATVSPIESNIDFLRHAKARGAYIIVYTARRMRTHGGDVKKVVEDVGDVTRETIKRFNIPCDELIFGKPYAHFYIDDLAVPAWGELEKWIGIYSKCVSARRHNTVDMRKDHVIKKSGNPGEPYFYLNVPDKLRKFFPSLISVDVDTIKMDKIEGEPASHAYASGSMRMPDVHSIMQALEEIHSYQDAPANFDVTRNYGEKLRLRRGMYDFARHGLEETSDKMVRMLDDYAKSGRIRGCIVHGDPVFSNIFLGRNVRLIDPRGRQGEELSLFGDMVYDFAKVHQSLSGYDSIILKSAFPKNRDELLSGFEDHIRISFGEDVLRDTRMVAASLLLSLLPLHDDINVPAFVELFHDRYGEFA